MRHRYGNGFLYVDILSLNTLGLLIPRMQSVFVQYPAPLGALTQLMVGTSPKTVDVNGGWFVPWARPYYHSRETHNPELESKLWDWIEEQRKGH